MRKVILVGACALVTGTALSCDDGSTMEEQPPAPPPAIEVTAPVDNSVFLRDLDDATGKLFAYATIEATANRPEVSRLVLYDADDQVLAEAGPGPDYQLELSFEREGVRNLRAVAYDAAGTELGTANLRMTIATVERECGDWLDMLGVSYQLGPEIEGIINPVTAELPIGGIEYRYYYDESFRSSLVADCTTIRSMALMAPYLRDRDIESVVDIGVYDYRCIGGGEPPGCPQGISQHALARAIDLHAFIAEDGTEYNVEVDWEIDGEDEPTCGAITEGPKDEWLHDLICEMYDVGLWNIMLTPNFNEAHRNHFHVDLTAGNRGLRTLPGVDVGVGHAH